MLPKPILVYPLYNLIRGSPFILAAFIRAILKVTGTCLFKNAYFNWGIILLVSFIDGLAFILNASVRNGWNTVSVKIVVESTESFVWEKLEDESTINAINKLNMFLDIFIYSGCHLIRHSFLN